MKNKESNCHSNKCNIWSLAPKGAGHQNELTVGRNVTSTLHKMMEFSEKGGDRKVL
jgi:hypothetical protein